MISSVFHYSLFIIHYSLLFQLAHFVKLGENAQRLMLSDKAVYVLLCVS